MKWPATVWNARLAYQLTPEVNLAVNANNLFDKSAGCGSTSSMAATTTASRAT
jgi:outer membrane receptor for ferric coprogen and ferric-rhodotorulic acid